MSDLSPYTFEELRALLPQVNQLLKEMTLHNPEAKGLPPLSEPESLEALHTLIVHAGSTTLTLEQQFLFGQLLEQYAMAVRATTLGYPGRYYVISEDMRQRIIEASDPRVAGTPDNPCEVLRPKPNKLFGPEVESVTRFLRYTKPVPCAECGRKSRHHWTWLVPFLAHAMGQLVLTSTGIVHPALTPVCRAHPLGPPPEPGEEPSV